MSDLGKRQERLGIIALEQHFRIHVRHLAGGIEKLTRQKIPSEQEQPIRREFHYVDAVLAVERIVAWHDGQSVNGRVEMWRSGCRLSIAVSAPFVWRCLSGSALTPFPHLAHRTGHADFPHPALGQDFTPSPTARRAQARLGVRARSAHKGARVDRSRPCIA